MFYKELYPCLQAVILKKAVHKKIQLLQLWILKVKYKSSSTIIAKYRDARIICLLLIVLSSDPDKHFSVLRAHMKNGKGIVS